MIRKEEIELIRKTIDPIKFLADRGVEVIQRGTSHVALCPIHNEHSPSFHVRPDWGRFHCFGCGFSGDIFALVEELDSLSFYGAITELAEYAGIKITNVEDDEKHQHLRRLYAITEATAQWFRDQYLKLPEGHPAKQNFAERNLLEEADNDPNIGYTPNLGLQKHLETLGYTLQDMREAGLLSEKGNLLFRKRVVWSIRNIQGKVVGFSARKIYETDQGPKYINSPQTLLYNKSATLFGLYEAHKSIVKTQTVYVVEGQADVMAMRAAGFTNTVAPCGTAFGKDHSAILQRLSDRGKDNKHFTIVFGFDGDAAGVKAAKKTYTTDPELQAFSQVVIFPEGQDPCDIRLREGDEGLAEQLSKTTPLTQFILQEEKNLWDVRTMEGQSKFLNEARTILKPITDATILDGYQRKISWWLGLPVDEVRNQLGSARNQKSVNPQATKSVVNLGELRKRVLACILQHPAEAWEAVNQQNVTEDMFQNEGKTIFVEAKQSFTPDMGQYDLTVFENQNLVTELLFVNLSEETTNPDNPNMVNYDSTTQTRISSVVENIVKVFATTYQMNENYTIQTRITGALGDENWVEDENLLHEILTAREGLGLKKRRLRTHKK